MIQVVLLSGTPKLSGSTTWINGLITGFVQLGIEHVHLVTGVTGDFPSSAQLAFYTGRPRSKPYIRLLRLLQIHKLNEKYFSKVEADFFSFKVKKLLSGKLAKQVLVIKDYSSYLPEVFKSDKFIVVDVLHQQYQQYQRGGHHDHLVAVSNSVLAESRKIGFKVEKVILNPLDAQTLHKKAAQYQPECSSPFILFVGNIYRAKGVFELLEVFSQGRDDVFLGYTLVFVGNGRDFNELKANIKKLGLASRVILTGTLVNPYPWIAAASLLVLPSSSEAMGYAAIEAAVLGVPYLVADFPAAKEFFCSDNIFKKNQTMSSTSSMLNKMVQLLQTKQSRLLPGLSERMRPEAVALEYYSFLQ